MLFGVPRDPRGSGRGTVGRARDEYPGGRPGEQHRPAFSGTHSKHALELGTDWVQTDFAQISSHFRKQGVELAHRIDPAHTAALAIKRVLRKPKAAGFDVGSGRRTGRGVERVHPTRIARNSR